MKIHIVVSTSNSTQIALGISKAATRAALEWSVFFTSDGVRTLKDPEFIDMLSKASSAVSCQESWKRYMDNIPCPVVLGSQTSNSAMVGDATHIVSL
jgi:sulfur relay (sulfurtransferase) complex TusBCD TusD component (DsrE family)